MASGLVWRPLAGARCCDADVPRAASVSRSRFRESSPVERVRRETFPKSARLRKRKEFLSIQREGRRQHTAHFVVIRRPVPEEPSAQLHLFRMGGYSYQVLVTNLSLTPLHLWRF